MFVIGVSNGVTKKRKLGLAVTQLHQCWDSTNALWASSVRNGFHRLQHTGLQSPFDQLFCPKTFRVRLCNGYSEQEIETKTFARSWNLGVITQQWRSTWVFTGSRVQLKGFIGSSQRRVDTNFIHMFCTSTHGNDETVPIIGKRKSTGKHEQTTSTNIIKTVSKQCPTALNNTRTCIPQTLVASWNAIQLMWLRKRQVPKTFSTKWPDFGTCN